MASFYIGKSKITEELAQRTGIADVFGKFAAVVAGIAMIFFAAGVALLAATGAVIAAAVLAFVCLANTALLRLWLRR